MTPTPCGGFAPRTARAENDPLKSPVKIRFTEWADAKYWTDLARLYLPRYDLPGWDVPYSAAAAEIWLDRLDLPLRDWLAVGNYTSLAEFGDLNPAWPLRAWIGLAMELRHERDGEGEKWA